MATSKPNGSSDKENASILLIDQTHYLSVLNRFAVSLLQQSTIDEIAWAIAKNAIAGLKFVDCVVYIIKDGELVQKAAHGPKNPIAFDILNPIKIPIGKGIVGSVAKSGKPEIIYDTSKDPRYILDDAFRFSEIAVPILAEDRVIGVIDSEHPDKNFFTKEHLELLVTIASMATTKILQAQAQEKIKQQNEELERIVAERTKELNNALENLQERNEELKTFSYTVSHDLKEPLRMISSYTGLIHKRYNHLLDKNGKDFMQYILNGTVQMKSLIDDLLNYSRVGFQSTEECKQVDLNITFDVVLANLHRSVKETNAIILRDKLPIIKGIKTILLQLFQNLVSNALKFRDKDKAIKIVVRYEEQEKNHYFSIQDNGIGIDSDQFEHIFGIFNRLNPKRFNGTGIGLAICKKIVEKHEGEIWVTSLVGEGSTFHFTLKK